MDLISTEETRVSAKGMGERNNGPRSTKGKAIRNLLEMNELRELWEGTHTE